MHNVYRSLLATKRCTNTKLYTHTKYIPLTTCLSYKYIPLTTSYGTQLPNDKQIPAARRIDFKTIYYYC